MWRQLGACKLTAGGCQCEDVGEMLSNCETFKIIGKGTEKSKLCERGK